MTWRMLMMYRIAAGIAVVALAAGLAQARQEWDQDAVNSLASDLAAATRALKETVRSEPQIAEGAQAGEPDVALFLESIDTLGKSARRLTRALVDNKGYEDTLPIATKIRTLVGDAEQYGADIMSAAWMQQTIAPVEELLTKISPYYFE